MKVIATFNSNESDLLINLWVGKLREPYWKMQYMCESNNEWKYFEDNSIKINLDMTQFRIITK